MPVVETSTELEQGAGLRRFAGNAFWMLVAEVTAKFASFAFVVIVARGLGAEQYGYFNFAISFFPLFLMLGAWGLDVALMREVARDERRLSRLFSSGLVLRAGLGLGAFFLAALVSRLFVGADAPLVALIVVGAALFFDEIASFLSAVFRAFERSAFHALVILANRVFSTGMAAVALAYGANLTLIAVTYLAGSVGAFLFAWVVLKRKFPPIDLRDFNLVDVRTLARQGGTIAVASFLSLVAFRVDAVLLQAIRGPVAVAMYGVAYRFLESFLFVSWSLATAVMPRLARAEGGPESARAFSLTATLLLSFYLPIAVGAPFAAEWVVVTLFSERYAAAATAVVWLTAAGVFYGIAHLSRIACLALGRRREIAGIAGAALALNVALNVVLIPQYGFVGAAAATCATEIVQAALLLASFVRANRVFRPSKVILVPAIASAGMALILGAFGMRDGGAVLSALVAYPALVVAAGRLLAPAELGQLARAFRRPRFAPAEGVTEPPR